MKKRRPMLMIEKENTGHQRSLFAAVVVLDRGAAQLQRLNDLVITPGRAALVRVQENPRMHQAASGRLPDSHQLFQVPPLFPKEPHVINLPHAALYRNQRILPVNGAVTAYGTRSPSSPVLVIPGASAAIIGLLTLA